MHVLGMSMQAVYVYVCLSHIYKMCLCVSMRKCTCKVGGRSLFTVALLSMSLTLKCN